MNVGFFYENKEFLVSCAVGLACVGLFVFFPTTALLDTLIASAVFLVIIPALYIKIVLRKPVQRSLGLVRPIVLKSLFPTLLTVGAVTIGLYLLLLSSSTFTELYIAALPEQIFRHFALFLLYEFVFILIFTILGEIFFRGFVLNILRARYKTGAIAIQAVLSIIPLMFVTQSFWILFSALVTALCAGTIAYRTNSVYYAILYSFVITLIFDSIIVKMASASL